jgi:antitoxin ParD1/3/4
MQTVNISLAEPLKEFVDEQISSGRYSSLSDYLSELIREDEKRKTLERLDGLIPEGLDSGDPIPADAGFWAERRSELLKRHNLRRKNDID